MPIQAVVDRQKSGYVRDFRLSDVIVFNIMGFALGLALSANPPFIGAFAPGMNVVLVIGFGAALAFFNGMTYGWFGAIMPSTGGDFVFVSRSLNHRLGFLTSWGFTVTQLYGLAINVSWILSVAIAPALTTLGVETNRASWINAGTMLTTPTIAAFGGFVLLIIYFLIAFFQITVHRVAAYIIFFIGLLGPLMMAYVVFTHSHSDFMTAYNAFVIKSGGQPDAYKAVLDAATQAKIIPATQGVLAASFQAIPLGFLCFLGFSYSVYVGGEVEKPARSQVIGIMTALVVGFVVFSIVMGGYVSLVGQEFNAAVGDDAIRAKLGIPHFSINYFVAILAPPGVNVIMQLGNLMWFLAVPYIMIQVCTHNLVAWSCDNLTPAALAKRSRSTNAPWVALLCVCMIAAIMDGAIAFYGFTLVGAVALVAVAFFLTGVGAYLLPKRRPDVFASAPRRAKLQFLDLTLFQLFGLISAAGFAWIIFSAVYYAEALSQGSKLHILIFLLCVYVSGLIWYQWHRNRLAQKAAESGVNLDDLFKIIPTD